MKKSIKQFQLGEYILKYSEDKVQLVEIIAEDITGIFFLRKDTSEIVGKFLLIEGGVLDIQELYGIHHTINGNEIMIFY